MSSTRKSQPDRNGELLTTDEAATLLRVSQKTVLRLIRSRQLRAEKVGRAWRIRRTNLPCLGGSQGLDDVVYLDDNASNPIDPHVVEAMTELWTSTIGNASSTHTVGQRSRERVEVAREQVAELVGARTDEVVFTSGATEANNTILSGWPYRPGRRRVLISAGEHDSVIRVVEALAEAGIVDFTIVPLRPSGVVDVDALDELLDDEVGLVSVVAANSETGVLNPLAEIASRTQRAGAAFHCDATQLIGRLPFSMTALGIDAASVSGHKLCGPQGVGAMIVRRRVLRQLRPLTVGGGHEGGLRSGTYNVPGIVGFGIAATLAAQPAAAQRMALLRDRLVERLLPIGGVTVNGEDADRLPNTANIRFAGCPGDAVLARTPQVAASLGSACHAGAIEPSPTLLAMGLDRSAAAESIRFSISRFTTTTDIDCAASVLRRTISSIRTLQQEVA